MGPIWSPSPERIAGARITGFTRDVADATGEPIADSRDLHAFSLAHPGDFWDAVWGECSVRGNRGDGPAFIPEPAGSDMRSARFFPSAALSFAENLLAGGDLPGAGEAAIVFHREDGVRRELTWPELREQVAALSGFLAAGGVGPGDVVAAWMPNVPETVVSMLAAARLGAIFTSTSPDFGVAGVLDRFGQVGPKVLVVADGYLYGGKEHRRLGRLDAVIAGLPTVAQVIVHGELDPTPDLSGVAGGPGGPRMIRWRDALGGPPAPGPAALMPFDQPLCILYSSGTTGAPKCIVHRAGGILLKHLVEHQLHCDIRPGDRVFYFTTCGWMMWNWLVSALASGATIVLYDGSPFHPGPSAMWDLVAEERATLFGTSAKFLDASAKAGVEPIAIHDLPALRTVCSTGSPLAPEGFEYVYDRVKSDVHLASISGGTDICGCFVIGDPTIPVYPGEIQGPALGMAVDVWDESGETLRDRPGDRGELVCTEAFPSLPLGFWGDPDGTRYEDAYFGDFRGVWAHGDFASWTKHGGIVIHGRSDATLNAAGVRIGTAEIYRQVEQIDGIAEALAVGHEWDRDTRIVLFVRLRAGADLSERLVSEIKIRLREHCSPRHVPAFILEAPDLPRTRSGKLAELAVADVVNGRPVRNLSGLANAAALAFFADIKELLE